MTNRITVLLLIIFPALFMMSCKTAEFGFKVFDINGMVYDFSNRPVANYEVALGRRYKGSTDINGRFTLSKVPIGDYTITGHKSGFEDYSDEVIIKEKGQIIYIRIPSQNQLLNLVDEALAGNNFVLAEEIAERAYQIDNNNIEMLFYCATAAFRQRNYKKAFSFLESAKNLGSRDLYVEKFLTVLKELQYEDQTK